MCSIGLPSQFPLCTQGTVPFPTAISVIAEIPFRVRVCMSVEKYKNEMPIKLSNKKQTDKTKDNGFNSPLSTQPSHVLSVPPMLTRCDHTEKQTGIGRDYNIPTSTPICNNILRNGHQMWTFHFACPPFNPFTLELNNPQLCHAPVLSFTVICPVPGPSLFDTRGFNNLP